MIIIINLFKTLQMFKIYKKFGKSTTFCLKNINVKKTISFTVKLCYKNDNKKVLNVILILLLKQKHKNSIIF